VLGALAALLVQYGLGIGANLYSTLPASDQHKSLFAGFGAAVSKGPGLVTAHAIFGTLLLVAAIGAFVRGLRSGRSLLAVLAGVALAAVLAAWLAGAAFIGHMSNGSSLSMALSAAVAIYCYALILYLA
jgi:hypothetical protein